PAARFADGRGHSRLDPARAIFAEEFIEFRVRHYAREAVERAVLGNLGGSLDEGVRGDARQRTADADAAHAHVGEVFDGKAERAAVEKIDRLRRHRLDGGLDLLAGLDAGQVEAIGAGVGEG